MRTRCPICYATDHSKESHTATCVICGEGRYFDTWPEVLAGSQASPYHKERRVYDCGDRAKHDNLRVHASRIPGDPEATPRKHATDGMSVTERRIQTQLWK